jgi:hypothetical protein
MAHPQVADGGDGLQKWRVVANVLHKQLQIPNKGGSPASGLGKGLTTSHCKKNSLFEMLQSLILGWILCLEDLGIDGKIIKTGLKGVDWMHLAEDRN